MKLKFEAQTGISDFTIPITVSDILRCIFTYDMVVPVIIKNHVAEFETVRKRAFYNQGTRTGNVLLLPAAHTITLKRKISDNHNSIYEPIRLIGKLRYVWFAALMLPIILALFFIMKDRNYFTILLILLDIPIFYLIGIVYQKFVEMIAHAYKTDGEYRQILKYLDKKHEFSTYTDLTIPLI
ncbi:hypothetical protein IKF94_02730 [Candidatus Saccharibacteria bacterium]|nr:hypothetical protein [Candidatus Saccharibacteria bacterium]